jgi:anti-sigma factor RsiW
MTIGEVRVRCSSCEPLIDRYIEGTLSARHMVDVAAHLRNCENCRALLDELKAVDGLLFTTRVPELPQNFTFAVMAEVNSIPAPRARQHPVWSFLALYSAAAWVAAVAGIAISGTSPAAVFGFIASFLTHAGLVSSAAAASVSRGFSHTIPTLAAFSVGVLVLDVAIAAAFAVLYFVLRPRLAAHLASSREAVS